MGPVMEVLTFRTILPRLMSNKNIVELVKDGDVEVDSILKKSGWKILIRPDPNHLLIKACLEESLIKFLNN